MQGFDYHRPTNVSDAVALTVRGGDIAYLAGGHTLLPAMKSGLRAPDALVDLGAIPGLAGVTLDGDRLWIGARTRHADVAGDSTVAQAIAALAELAGGIGDPQVRARGTLGGSLANNDPAADYPAAVLALDAVIETDRGSHAADDYFQGMFATSLTEGELITRVGFRRPQAAAYAKFRHPASRYALTGVFVARYADGVRVAVTGAGPGVFRWAEAEGALAAGAALAGLQPDAADLNSDIHASAEFRAHLTGVMLRQAAGALA